MLTLAGTADPPWSSWVQRLVDGDRKGAMCRDDYCTPCNSALIGIQVKRLVATKGDQFKIIQSGRQFPIERLYAHRGVLIAVVQHRLPLGDRTNFPYKHPLLQPNGCSA